MKIAAVLFSLIVNRKSLIVLFFTILYSLFSIHFSGNVHAQACSATGGSTQDAINNLNKCAIEKDIFDDKIFNLNQIAGTADSLYTMLLGGSQLHPETNTVTQGGGALAASGKLVATLYGVPPASGVNYLAKEFQKFNLAQPAYAQTGTIGFDALQPVQNIWRVFRNISYVGFVIVFVVMGFMIMFRAHISPQAVATIQDSVPRIVVALILVTFSYAIAGLMVDLMFLLLNITINTLQASGLLTQQGNIIFEKSVFGVILDSWDDVVGAVKTAIESAISAVIGFGFLGDIIGFFGGSIAGIIVGIALLFIMFRVFLMLLMSYVMIIILTIAAPFFFLIQALPGNNGAREWFKQIAANIAVFPTVALMFIFAGILGGLTSLGGSGASTFTTQQIGQFPLLVGGLTAEVVGKLIAIGLLLMTPEAANMVKNFITGGRGGGGGAFGGAALGGAIGGAIGAGAAPVGAFGRRAGQFAWQRSPIAGMLRTGEAMRQERYGLQAKEKIYQKPSRVGLTKEQLQKRGIGYGD